ncbi:MAG: GmrSD restriction endonuclease domain-containing protein [Actinomycetales bacterium]
MSSTGSMFTASSVKLTKLLDDCHTGQLQLPDFQRSWVWDEERIKSLIASVSRGFPIGAVMTLGTGGNVEFQPRMIEGSDLAVESTRPDALLLDGQQRLTSLYQVLVRGEVIETVTPRKQKVKRWFYIDIDRAIDSTVDREEAVISVPPEKKITSDFGRKVELDVSTRELEIENMMFPVSMILNWNDWQRAYIDRYSAEPDFQERFGRISDFHDIVIQNIAGYLVPVIELDKSTSKEAVCVVFEKVNTGGKSLDAFELITAMYAADGYELRKDWYDSPGLVGRKQRFTDHLRMPSASAGVLAGVGNTDFLQVISLFHTRDLREQAAGLGKTGKELPQVSLNRQALLSLPLEAYKKYQDEAEYGFKQAAKFLIRLGIFRVRDLPYQSQVVPIAAILSELGERAEEAGVTRKLNEWFWNGVFGELYGSSTETRVAKDFIEVLRWVNGGEAPATVHDATLRADRLRTMRMRLSAAYKGVNALLMTEGAKDFRTGQAFTHTVFFDENVDIHHIFPKDWCKKQGIESSVYDSIINKTPLTSRTNRIIGGSAPSAYLKALEDGSPENVLTQREEIDAALRTHLVDPDLLRSDNFVQFIKARQAALVRLIEEATGKQVVPESPSMEKEDYADDEEEAA